MAFSIRTSTKHAVSLLAEHPFLVHAAALRRVPGTTRSELRLGVIDDLGSVGVAVPEGAPVEADVTLASYPGGIMVTGTVSAPWVGECRRCGGMVSGAVAASVRERYVPAAAMSDDPDSPDADAYPLRDDLLDLEPLARDAVLLDLPLAPLCSEDCQGLCVQCGSNLNLGTCGCQPLADPRWSALDQLGDGEGDSLA